MQTDEIIESALKTAREWHIYKCGARDPRKCGCNFKFQELKDLRLSFYKTQLTTRQEIARDMERARKEMINDNEEKSDNVFFIDSIYKIFIDIVNAGGLL